MQYLNSPVEQPNSLVLIDFNSQILESGDQLLKVHFPVAVLVQVRKLQSQVLLVLPYIMNELGQADVPTVGLIGGFQEFLQQ